MSELLELPLHIQDGALFYAEKLGLSEREAGKRCQTLIENAQTYGGVLTVLWHDRSHGPERFWGEFYLRLLNDLKAVRPWFATADQVVRWFRKRRSATFERVQDAAGKFVVTVQCPEDETLPPLAVKVHRASSHQAEARREASIGADRFPLSKELIVNQEKGNRH
jgi:hypothetical protein